MRIRSMNFIRPQSQLAPETTSHPAHDWNTIRATMPLTYSTPTGIRSRSSIKANDGTGRPSSLILSHDRFSAIVADQIERNSERDNVLKEKQAEIVHVMDAMNHDGVIRSRDQHGACGEEHAD